MFKITLVGFVAKKQNPLITQLSSSHASSIRSSLGLLPLFDLRRAQQPPQPSAPSSSAADAMLVLDSLPYGCDNMDTLLLAPGEMDHVASDAAKTASPIPIPSAPTVPQHKTGKMY